MSRSFSKDFLIEVQKGKVSGHALLHKFGRCANVPNGSWVFINTLCLTAWPLSAATTVRIKAGGNVNDTAAGTGAREITIQGIDSSFNEITETIATAGASASANTAASFWRVNRMWVSAVGTYEAANTGNIVLEDSGGVGDIIEMMLDEGQSQFAQWTVPIGKTAYLLETHIHVDSNKTSNIRLFTREDIDDITAPMPSKRVRVFFDGVQGEARHPAQSPEFALPEKSDIWVEAFGDGAVSHVSCSFEMLIVDN